MEHGYVDDGGGGGSGSSLVVEGSRSDAKNAPSFLPSFEYTTANIPLLSY